MDFILDYRLTPWLIEVNLSPACAERTEWLTDMLDSMTEGLLDTIEAKILRLHEDFEPDLLKAVRDRQTKKKEVTPEKDPPKSLHQWDLIYDQRTDPDSTYNFLPPLQTFNAMLKESNNQQLEVFGRKVNVKLERRMHYLYRQYLAAVVI